MADWTLYPVDRAALRIDSITADTNNATAGNVVRIDTSSVWIPSTNAGDEWGIDLGASRNLIGIAFGNHTLSGEQMSIWSGTSATVKQTEHLPNVTFPDNRDVVFVKASAFTTRYVIVVKDSISDSGDYIGTISILDSDAKIAISQGGPYQDIGRTMHPGEARIRVASGAEIVQILGGTAQELAFNLQYIPSGAGSIAQAIYDSYEDNDGWAHGVWITDETFGSVTSNQGRGYYCKLVQGPVPSAVQNAVGHTTFQMTFLSLRKGKVGSF